LAALVSLGVIFARGQKGGGRRVEGGSQCTQGTVYTVYTVYISSSHYMEGWKMKRKYERTSSENLAVRSDMKIIFLCRDAQKTTVIILILKNI
jgi:hypothetical protein